MSRSRISIALTALLAVSALVNAEDWPNYRGPRHDGVSTEKLAADSWPQTGPRVVWQTPTLDGFSSFTVADGRVFTLVTREIEGVPRETVVGLEAETGKELWAYAMSISKYDGGGARGTRGNDGGDGARSTPTVNDGWVFALDSRLLLVCLEAGTGREVWKKNLITEHKGQSLAWGNAASPVIEGDLLFVAGGGPGEALLGIDRKTGKTVWKAENDKMTHATPVVADIHGERQVIFFTQTGLVAVRPADGTVRWRQDYPYNVSTAASPVVAGDLVYCSAAYKVGAGVYRISREGNAFKSTEVWRERGKLENHWSTPVYLQGHVYGIYGHGQFGEAPLKCVELATGTEKWSQNGFGPGNITLVEGHLIVLGDAGQLVLVEARSDQYSEKARADVLDGKCWSTPTYSGGRIFVRSTKEGACLELSPKVATR